jgi:hypothetical protein
MGLFPFFFLNFMFVLYKNFQFWVVPGIFFAWHHIFAMLPAADAHLFGSFNSINLSIFLFAGYCSFGKYNSPSHFYSPPLLCSQVVTEPGLLTPARSLKVKNLGIFHYEQLTAAHR